MSGPVHAILGAGRQGLAAGLELVRHGGSERLVVADQHRAAAREAADRLDAWAGRPVAEPVAVDATDARALGRLLADVDGVLSALPYHLNPVAAEAAVDARTHFVDLGGNPAVSDSVLALHASARRAGVTLVPDCGVAPGLVGTLTALLVESIDDPRQVRLRCGGLPQEPSGPLDYQLSFSIEGLTNEYLGEAEVLRGGRRERVPTLDELEHLDLPEPLGPCEAFTTSGATATLPRTYEGRLRELDYKTIRYPGHLAKVRAIRDLGLLDGEPVDVPGGRVRPRDVFHAVAAPRLQIPGPDLLFLRAELAGTHAGRAVTARIDILDRYDPVTGLTAMQRMTGFPAAMVLEALTDGRARPGATPLEAALPPGPLVDGLPERGIQLERSGFPE